MSKGQTFQAELLDHILNNVALALVGDAAGLQPSAANGNLYVALHNGDPGETGNQTTNELSYTGYARVPVARNPASKQWTVTVASPAEAVNAAEVAFGAKTAGTDVTPTHFSIGTSAAGTGKICYSAALSQSILIQNGITPRYAAGDLKVTEE